jgi:hypothetical protein
MLEKMIVLLAFAVTAAAAATGAGATQPQAVTLDLVGHITGPGTIAGTWTATGAFTDAGTYTETFRFAGETVHVERVLVGNRGTIVLAARGLVVWVSPCTAVFAAGNWTIRGVSGAYSTLQGGGTPAVDAASSGDICTGAIHAVHVGEAHE